MSRHTGILLNIIESQRPVYVLVDRELGKFSAVAARNNLCRGALLSYSVDRRRSVTYLYGIDLLDLPNIYGEHDLIFFHQVLELIYYFLPVGKSEPEVFALLLYLYVSFEQFHTDSLKKLFLSKLFAHLGFYPEADGASCSFFAAIRTKSIEAIICSRIDLSLERKLDQWLDYCISLHPCTDCFKAISHFMSRKP